MTRPAATENPIGGGQMMSVFVNPEMCIGCLQCEFACAVEHSKSRDPFLALFEDPQPHTRIHVEPGPVANTSFPNRCRHCSPAPCQQVCPTAAITRNVDLDLVLVDPGKCIACAMCAMVCPFDAVTFFPTVNGAPARITATKCDGCMRRVEGGEIPACVEACKVRALVYGEVNEIVARGRLQQAGAVLAAAASIEVPSEPDPIEGWRAFGRELTSVTGSV